MGNIAVAFKGQLYKNAADSTNYVFPQENSEWAASLDSDPRDTLGYLNINGNHPCYTIKFTPYGIVYAYRHLLPERSGSNCAMIMLLAGGPTLSGKELVGKMDELLAHAVSQNSSDQIDQDFLSVKLSKCDVLFYGNRRPSVVDGEASRPEAYRIYNTDEELYKNLERPYQPAYNKYSCIHIVPADANATPYADSNLKLIEGQLEPIYFLTLPEGVKEVDNKKYVGKGESFRLEYVKEGYSSYITGFLYVSNNSDYFEVKDDEIVVNPADKCKQVDFKREIQIKVQNSFGNPITSWRWKNKKTNWRECTTDILKLELTSGEYVFQIQSEGYVDEDDVRVNTSREQEKVVTLKSKSLSKKVYLKPAWGKKDKSFSSKDEHFTLNYTKNTALYKKYEKQLDPHVMNSPTFYVSTMRPKKKLIFWCIVSLLLGIGVGFFANMMVTSLKDKPQISSSAQNPSNGTEGTRGVSGGTVGNPGPTSAVTNIPSAEVIQKQKEEEEQQDVQYLNSNNVWELSRLQSSKYKDFFVQVVSNKTQYKDVNWEDYDEINNPKWNIIKNAIIEGVENEKNNKTPSWTKLNGLNYAILKQNLSSSGRLDLDESVKARPAGTAGSGAKSTTGTTGQGGTRGSGRDNAKKK